jgi:hypothetical protein
MSNSSTKGATKPQPRSTHLLRQLKEKANDEYFRCVRAIHASKQLITMTLTSTDEPDIFVDHPVPIIQGPGHVEAFTVDVPIAYAVAIPSHDSLQLPQERPSPPPPPPPPLRQHGLGRNVTIGAGSKVDPTSFIGNNCHVHAGVTIGPHVEISRNCHFHHGVTIQDGCTIGRNCHFHMGARVESNASIGRNCHFQMGSQVKKGAILPDGTTLGMGQSFPS